MASSMLGPPTRTADVADGVDVRRQAGRDRGLDQPVRGVGVGDAQQRFGEAHQRHAFLARQRIFMHQPFDAGALVLGPQCCDQLAGGVESGLGEGFLLAGGETEPSPLRVASTVLPGAIATIGPSAPDRMI